MDFSQENINTLPFLPEVSVVIPIYNGEDDLPDLIQCLYSQTYPRNQVGYFLVDNRSQDKTANTIKAASQKAKNQGLSIHYVAENHIQCVSAARNAGIRASSGDIIAFTDVDCRPKPDWLYKIIQPFADSRIGVVGGSVSSLPSKTIFEEYAKRGGTLSHEFPHTYDPPFALGANHAVRRKAFEQVGLYRPYLSGCDDIDMCWRIQQHNNWQFLSVVEAIIQHRHRDNLPDIIKQWRGYGRGYSYLKDLYGFELLRGWDAKYFTLRYYTRAWLRWLLKELPLTSFKVLAGKATLLDIVMTPIFLLARHAQARGRREGILTDEMKEIEWLPST